MTHSKYIIIGAGLSGLTTAHQLFQKGEQDFIILESRDRIGGRIHTENGIDLGATWYQRHHHQMVQMMEALNVPSFPQYSAGKSVLVYSSMAPAHYFESDKSSPAARRIAGGSMALIEALVASIVEKIQLDTRVHTISKKEKGLSVETSSGVYFCEKIVVAIPPNLASNITFEPKLPLNLTNALENTHTWMSNAMKVGITYERPFWREKGFSGTIIGQVGPTIELYDHSAADGSEFSLMGFVNETLRDESEADRKERILAYLEKYIGTEVRSYLTFTIKDWAADKHTSCDKLKSLYMSPRYGNPVFSEKYMDGCLLFSGAETSQVSGGYMDGAVYSGLLAAAKLMNES